MNGFVFYLLFGLALTPFAVNAQTTGKRVD